MDKFENKHIVAIDAAIAASKKIMEIYQLDFETQFKADASPVTAADIRSSDIILSHLLPTNIPIICEETEAIPYDQRKHTTELWCVDPLDGTREFVAKNDQFCVCIALISSNFPSYGVIASPTEELVYFGGEEMGTFYCTFENWDGTFNHVKSVKASATNDPLHIASSRSHINEATKDFIVELKNKYPNLKNNSKGSALKFIDMAEGRIDIYPRFGPTNEWDIAAGQALVEGVGGTIIEPNSLQRLSYNKEEMGIPGFIAYKTKALQ